jgi:hypothetical protein
LRNSRDFKKELVIGANSAVRFCERRHFSVKNFLGLAIIPSLPFIMAGKAAPQYGGGTSRGGSGSGIGTYVPPKGGYSSATGAAVGAGAAAGATGLFLTPLAIAGFKVCENHSSNFHSLCRNASFSTDWS